MTIVSGRPSASSVLFGDGGSDGDVTGLNEVVEAAEAAYEEGVEAGEPVDLIGDEGSTPESDAPDESEDTDGDTESDTDSDENAESDEDASDTEDTEADTEDADSDESEDEEPETSTERALRFRDQAAAEAAYAEAQAHMNRVQQELHDLRMAQAQNQTQPDGLQQIAQVAADNPQAAFGMALEAGNVDAANQIIARVATDATRMSAQAIIARDEGDDDNAMLWEQRATNAAMIAEQMREQKMTAQYEAAMTPMREDKFVSDLSSAAQRAMSRPSYQGIDMSTYDAQIGAYVEQNPHIMGDWSPRAMEEGFATAANAVVLGGNLQAVIEARVEAELAARGAAAPVPKRKDRGTGGGQGRKAPVSKASDDPEGDEIRNSFGSNRPKGMDILFGA